MALGLRIGPAERLLALIFWSAALFIGGYFLGKSDEREDQKVEQAEALGAAIVTHNQAVQAGAAASKRSAVRSATKEAAFDAIESELRSIEAKATPSAQGEPHAKSADLDCTLDLGRLQLWRAANAGDFAGAAGERSDALPGDPATAGIGEAAGSGREPRPDDAPVPPLHGAPSRPGRVVGGN